MVPHCGRDNDGIVHWWLVDGKTIVDITASQYYCMGKRPPYDKGRACGFLTKEPSERCKEILRRLNEY